MSDLENNQGSQAQALDRVDHRDWQGGDADWQMRSEQSGRETLRRQGDLPVPLWVSVPALALAAGLGYAASATGENLMSFGLLVGAAAAGGLGIYGLGERALLRSVMPRRGVRETFMDFYDGAPEMTALVAANGRLLAMNRAARAGLSGNNKRARDLLAGSPEADAITYRLLRDALAGRFRRERVAVPGQAMIDIAVWPGTGRTVIWRWRLRDMKSETDALAGAAERAGLGWFRVNAEGDILEMNPVLQAWVRPGIGGGRLSIQKNRTVRHLSAILPEASRKILGTRLNRTVMRTRLLGGSSAPRNVSLLFAPLRVEGGGPDEAIGLVAPIAAADAEQSALPIAPDTGIDAENFFGAQDAMHTVRLFEEAPIGVAVLSQEGRILRLNGAAQRLLDGAADLGDNLIDAIALDDRDEAVRRLTAVIANGAPDGPSFEATLGKAASTVEESVVAQFYFSRLETKTGPLLLTYMVDASVERALEERFRQTQRLNAVGQLAGGVAHDFNNLLTVISGCSEVLLMRHSAEGDPDYAELSAISQNAQRAANLVRQLLAYSRKQQLRPDIVNLTDTLSETSHMLDRLIGEKVTLHPELAEDLWPCRVDATQFEQVITNLVVNARDAITEADRPQGQILLRTKNQCFDSAAPSPNSLVPPGDYVSIEVIDNGTGIPADKLAKIFDPFYTTKEVGKGTGLGLSTVYGIVKQSGGFIFADSTTGQGTAFRIYLPRYQGSGEPVAPASPGRDLSSLLSAGVSATLAQEKSEENTGPAPASNTKRILLVEDEDPVRQMTAKVLRANGYDVLEAGDGEEALEILQDSNEIVDLMLSDVIMPNIDGPTLARTVRDIRPNLRTVFMSGYPRDAFDSKFGEDQLQEGPDQQLTGFIQKPFKLAELTAVVRRQLSE